MDEEGAVECCAENVGLSDNKLFTQVDCKSACVNYHIVKNLFYALIRGMLEQCLKPTYDEL